MAISLTIKYYRSKIETESQSYDLKVVAESAIEMPKEIFIFQRTLLSASTGVLTDRFISIADPVDLEEVPLALPDLKNEMPYFRLNEVTLNFRSVSELEDTKDLIDADIQRLVTSLVAAQTVDLFEEKTYE